MSQTKNREQAARWLKTAEEDFLAVQTLDANGLYAQACFFAQQSGEKAVKSLWYWIGADPWGHSIQRLLMDFSDLAHLENFQERLDDAALLDKFYIPTRYPNGLPDLTPGQVYRKGDAEQGLKAASNLLAACKAWIGRREGGDD